MKYKLAASQSRLTVIDTIMRSLNALSGDKEWQVEIKPYRKIRTLQQNKYLWGVVYPTIRKFYADHEGKQYSDEGIHEHFKRLYCTYTVESTPSGDVKLYRSTTKLTPQEFSNLFENIFRDAAEAGIQIPPADFKWDIAA